MSSVTFSFNPSAIPASAQAEFMARFFQLMIDYQAFTNPLPVSPPADSVPAPTSFVAVDGDDSAPVAPKKPRKNGWANLTDEQRSARLAAMTAARDAKRAARKMSDDSLAVPAPVVVADPKNYDAMSGQELRDALADRMGIPPTPSGAEPSGFRRNSAKFPTKADLIAELRRLDAAPATEVADNSSETSSKNPRKPRAPLTDEQRAARNAKRAATLAAKKAAADATTTTVSDASA